MEDGINTIFIRDLNHMVMLQREVVSLATDILYENDSPSRCWDCVKNLWDSGQGDLEESLRAVRLFYQAAQGDADAQFRMVRVLSGGWGLKPDVNLAAKFYRLAIKNGNKPYPRTMSSGLAPEQEAYCKHKIRMFVLQHSHLSSWCKDCKAAYLLAYEENAIHFEFWHTCSPRDVSIPLRSGHMFITEDGSLWIEHCDRDVCYHIDECQGDSLINASEAIDKYYAEFGMPEECPDIEATYLSEKELDDLMDKFESYLASVAKRWEDAGLKDYLMGDFLKN